jgi:hypothetical protein
MLGCEVVGRTGEGRGSGGGSGALAGLAASAASRVAARFACGCLEEVGETSAASMSVTLVGLERRKGGIAAGGASRSSRNSKRR